MKKILIAVVISVLAFSGSAQQKRSEKEYESAYRLMVVLKVEKILNEETENQINKYVRRAPFLQKSKPKFREFCKKNCSYPVVKQGMADILLANFTVAELDKFTAFFSTPEGQKILNKARILEKQFSRYAKWVLEQHRDELQQMIQDELSAQMERR